MRERLATGEAPGRYQILAAINAVHTSARDDPATPTGGRSWPSTTSSSASTPRRSSPSTGPSRSPSSTAREVALAAVDRLEDRLAGYHAYHATRADLLRRLGRSQESRAAYDRAIELAGNTAETAYLTRRRDQLE